MIKSLLDNDLYKFTMQNAVMKLYPHSKVKYKFINRGKNNFSKGFNKKLQEKINLFTELRLTEDEEKFLREKCYFLDPVYIDFLKGFQFDPKEVIIHQKGNKLYIDIEGYWYRTILWEVPILALVSELYFEINNNIGSDKNKNEKTNITKAKKFEKLGAKFADFGTRRRYSYNNHLNVNRTLKKYAPTTFTGTSNVHLAHKLNLTPIGTQAHEWFMFHAAKYGFKMANPIALGRWVDIYHGNLGIALSDTFTSEAFFESFDTMYAKLFDGVRQDSGDPVEFAKALVEHYKRLRIDPKLKTIVFSDGLNFEKVKDIEIKVKKLINTSYGIGTYLSNDLPDVTPLNIVIKLTEAAPFGDDWASTIKLSDVSGKHTGNEKVISLAKQVLGIMNIEKDKELNSALIVVDVQNDFCEGGALEVKNGNEVIPVINKLIKSQKFNFIIATQDWHPKEHKSFASNNKNKNIYDIIKLNGIDQVLWPDHCIQNTKGSRFHQDLDLGKKYKVFRKGTNIEIDSYSGFYDNDHKSSTGLTEYLRKNNIDKVFITGLASDYCVKFTAIDSVSEGFKTYIIKDAVKGVNINRDDSKRAFSEMKTKSIKIISSEKVMG